MYKIRTNILWYAIAFFSFAMWVGFAYGEWTCQQCVEVTTPNPTPTPVPTPTPTPTPPPIPTPNPNAKISLYASGIGGTYESGMAYTVSVTLSNLGAASTFTLSSYLSAGTTLGGQLLFTDTLSLGAGQSVTKTYRINPGDGCATHTYCRFNYFIDGTIKKSQLSQRTR